MDELTMSRITKLMPALLSGLSLNTFATLPLLQGKWLLELGGTYSSQSPTQVIAISEGSLGNIHSVYRSKDLRFLTGLGYFFDILVENPLSIGFGPQIYYQGKNNTAGLIFIERAFPNLDYLYQTKNIPFYAALKAKWQGQDEVSSLVFNLGLGPNFVKTKGYYERSLDDGVTIPNQAFSGQSRTHFSAMAGLGLQFKIPNNKFAFEIGYKYFYLGEGALKPRPGFLNSLTTGYQNTHAFTLSLLA